MTIAAPDAPRAVDSCGNPTCDRAPGSLLCERCSRNLDALAKALDEEGIQLQPQEPQ